MVHTHSSRCRTKRSVSRQWGGGARGAYYSAEPYLEPDRGGAMARGFGCFLCAKHPKPREKKTGE